MDEILAQIAILYDISETIMQMELSNDDTYTLYDVRVYILNLIKELKEELANEEN